MLRLVEAAVTNHASLLTPDTWDFILQFLLAVNDALLAPPIEGGRCSEQHVPSVSHLTPSFFSFSSLPISLHLSLSSPVTCHILQRTESAEESKKSKGASSASVTASGSAASSAGGTSSAPSGGSGGQGAHDASCCPPSADVCTLRHLRFSPLLSPELAVCFRTSHCELGLAINLAALSELRCHTGSII